MAINVSETGPRISVILPVLNWGDHLQEAVQSVMEQSFEDIEIIIISEDKEVLDTVSKHFGDGRIVTALNDGANGLTPSLNLGLSLAKGEYIARMDSDDVCHRDRFSRQVDYLDAHRDVGVLGTAIAQIDPQGNALGVLRFPANPSRARWDLHFYNALAHSSVMMRKEIVERLGGYSDVPLCEDYELWLRAMRITNLANLDDPLLCYRMHKGSVSSSGRDEQAERANDLAIRAMGITIGKPVERGPALAVINPYRVIEPKEASEGAHFLYSLYRNFVWWNKMTREEIMDVKWAASERMSHLFMRSMRVAPTRTSMVLWQTSRFGPGVDWRFAVNVMRRGKEKVAGKKSMAALTD